MILTDFLASNSYIITNKLLIRNCRNRCYNYIRRVTFRIQLLGKTGQLTNEECFFSTRKNIEHNTGLSNYGNFEELDYENLNINNNNKNNKNNNKEYMQNTLYKNNQFNNSMNTKRNYKSNYEQRVYPERFFDQFYANFK